MIFKRMLLFLVIFLLVIFFGSTFLSTMNSLGAVIKNSSSPVTPQILDYNILNKQSSLELNSGGSYYIYTAVDGGGVSITGENFINVGNVTDGNGVISADTGYSYNNYGSYNNNNAAIYAIGGISVGSNFGVNNSIPKYINYSANGSYGAHYASLNFKVNSSGSLAVIIGAGSVNSNPKLNGNFSFKVLDELNSQASIIQAYSVLNQNSYTVNLTMTPNGTNLNGCSVLLAVYVFSPAVFQPPLKYNVNFIENGLPSGTTWYVSLGNSTLSSSSNTITFQESNGTYRFSIQSIGNLSPYPSSGSLTVQGHPLNVSVTFSPPKSYVVNFNPQGIPPDYQWWVVLNNTKKISTGLNSISFTLTNGTYNYEIGGGAGYIPSPSKGMVMVSGQEVNVSISFVPEHFNLIIIEKGLPSGMSWYVILNGNEYSSSNSTIIIPLTDGNYKINFVSFQGFKPQKNETYVNIDNSNSTVYVQYSFISPSSLSFLDSPSYMLMISLIILVALAFFIFILFRGGKDGI